MRAFPTCCRLVVAMAAVICVTGVSRGDQGVYVRFQLVKPTGCEYYVRLGGYIHKSPWYLPRTVVPPLADKEESNRVAAGDFTPWFDLKKHAEGRLHGRLNRSGGLAEFPNVTADFVCEPPSENREVVIELATSPDAKHVVKRFRESFRGSLTSFLVSPDLRGDADNLETAAEMAERRLRWAREASGGKRVSPKELIVQTSFWGPQREELNLKEADVLHLLGFNVVGNQRPEVREKFDLRVPGHTHGVRFGPGVTREEVDEVMKKHASRHEEPFDRGVPFGFSDEIVCRPPIGDNEQALKHFRAWLAAQRISPRDLGVRRLEDVQPIETPVDLRERTKKNEAAARRIFYYTSRFRQHAATERVGWHTESFRRHFPAGAVTSMLVADHPYFAGSGLGMGMTPNPAWSGYPLASDWFDVGRKRPVDMIGIEDWMGLQFMYGPNWTWEGFQLMGFQASIFRSASNGSLPIIAWITPSDETNLRLKSASALCQGAKHFFYWTYGPTATSTENYWSDLRSAYDGITSMTRNLAAAERIIAPGKPRKTRVALLYSISSDLWQPFGYVHMLERRATYLSLVHEQYLVDMLTEEDIESGRLDRYDVLYATDPCISEAATSKIIAWAKAGGYLYGTCAAGSRNQFNEPSAGLSPVFGVEPSAATQVQTGRYHIRGALNDLPYIDQIQAADDSGDEIPTSIGVIGTKVALKPTTAETIGVFRNGAPAVVTHDFGKGKAIYIGACPGLDYIKEAKFVPSELKEKWPADIRRLINSQAGASGASRLVELSHPVVEAGVYDADAGTALVLANFTYEPIQKLEVSLRTSKRVKSVRSVSKGKLDFSQETAGIGGSNDYQVKCAVELGLDDILLFE